MCTNYRPTARDHLRENFGTPEPDFDWPAESYPGYLAPIVRRAQDGTRQCLAACFGLVPAWARDRKIARNTYNARSETVAEKPSYRAPWRRGQFCLVPMDWFYEPCYESGKAERWRIARPDGSPFAVGAIWERWVDPDSGEVVHSFSMLTVNADRHPVMGRMFLPQDEKRSLVVVAPADFDRWLGADAQLARSLIRAPAADELVTSPSPKARTGHARA